MTHTEPQASFDGRVLEDSELEAISGGFEACENLKFESQLQHTMSGIVTDIIKNFG